MLSMLAQALQIELEILVDQSNNLQVLLLISVKQDANSLDYPLQYQPIQYLRFRLLSFHDSKKHLFVRLIEPFDIWAHWMIVFKLNLHNSPPSRVHKLDNYHCRTPRSCFWPWIVCIAFLLETSTAAAEFCSIPLPSF